jgi:hypothetical protein
LRIGNENNSVEHWLIQEYRTPSAEFKLSGTGLNVFPISADPARPGSGRAVSGPLSAQTSFSGGIRASR